MQRWRCWGQGRHSCGLRPADGPTILAQDIQLVHEVRTTKVHCQDGHNQHCSLIILGWCSKASRFCVRDSSGLSHKYSWAPQERWSRQHEEEWRWSPNCIPRCQSSLFADCSYFGQSPLHWLGANWFVTNPAWAASPSQCKGAHPSCPQDHPTHRGENCHIGCESGDVVTRVLGRWCSKFYTLNSLQPSDAIWWHRSGSALAQVIACCLRHKAITWTKFHVLKNDFEMASTSPGSNIMSNKLLLMVVICCMFLLVIWRTRHL